MDLTPLAMFAVTFAALLAGYPVALTLGGVALLFALGGTLTGAFSPTDLGFAPGRLFGTVTNQTLIAVPLFVFMGVMLEKSRVAEDLLVAMSRLFGRYPVRCPRHYETDAAGPVPKTSALPATQ